MCWPWTRIIAKTKDAEERQKLLQEHMQTMRDNMMASKSMMGCPMMKDGMMGGGMGMMGGGETGASPDAMMNRMQMMMAQMAKPQSQLVPAK